MPITFYIIMRNTLIFSKAVVSHKSKLVKSVLLLRTVYSIILPIVGVLNGYMHKVW